MHLALDAVGQKQAGVATVLLDVLAAAEADPGVSQVTLFCSPRSVRSFDLPLSSKIVEMEESRAENLLFRLWWYQRALPARAEQVGADVLLCLHSAGLSPRTMPHVTFIQRPLEYPSDARARVPLRHRYRLPAIRMAAGRSCRSAHRVLVQTPSMGRSVQELFGVPEENVEVVLPGPRKLPLGVSSAPELAPMRAATPGLRILFVGQLFAHKNVAVLLNAMEELRSRLPGVRFFLSGPPDYRLATASDVTYLGVLPDYALREAYELASVLVMPSLYETVGLPMLEAMSVGTPVLAADRPYAHDVCEEAAMFFDPLSPQDCAEKICTLLQSSGLQQELVERGSALVAHRLAARPYDRMIAATLEVAEAWRAATCAS